MTLRTLIIDDEPLAHKVILEYAKDVNFLEIVGQSHLATEAYALLQNQAVDLIFLDINMPKIQGLDFLRTLEKKPIVIITSAYEEYALESYELSVCDYLLKPFRFDRFLKAINKAHEQFQLRNRESEPSSKVQHLPEGEKEKKSEQVFIKSDKRLIQLSLNDIYYLESYGNYVKVWLEKDKYLTPQTLTSFESQFPQSDFFRIHKSFMLNRKYIDYVEGNFVLLKNGKQLPIGKNQRSTFKKFING